MRNAQPTRRSKHLSDQLHSPVIQANKETKENEVQTSQHEPNRIFGLGVPSAPTPTPAAPMFEIIEEPRPTKRTNIPNFRTPRLISQEGLFALATGVMESRPAYTVPTKMETANNATPHFNIEHFCSPVVHPTTEKLITKYSELANDAETREIWTTAFGKEWED